MIEILGLREMPLMVSIPYLIDTEPPPKRRKVWHEGRIRIKMHLGSLFERPHPTKGLCGQGCCRKSVAGAGLPHPFVATSCLLPHKCAQFLSLLIRFLPIQPDLKEQGIAKCSLSLGTLDAVFPSCHKVPAFQRVTERGAGRWPSPAGQDVGQERTAPPVPHRPLSSPAELSRSPSASPWVMVGSG